MAVAHVGISITSEKVEEQKAFSAAVEGDDAKPSTESSFTEEQWAFLATFNALGDTGGRVTSPDSDAARRGSSGEQGGRHHRRDIATIRCHGCGEMGHFRYSCPKAGSSEAKD
jgi:hypothetical protein